MELELHDEHQRADELLARRVGQPRRHARPAARLDRRARRHRREDRSHATTARTAGPSHHNSDLWRQSAPVGDFGEGDPVWAFWPMGGPWLAQHLWKHYAFGGDASFCATRAYPVMKGAAEFCLDWLIDDGKGHLVTAPSTSPEHKFVLPDGQARGDEPGVAPWIWR